ncbi:MAG TPA: flagellar basal body rod protein FlgC [Sedimentisphaerales bacterium]|jgi:flagellar basal-body rod protein FlgC|nr:flagellar basal body rod protein FlgC [Sedimentisphaerales bacterium]HNU27726.1 flagellar basal body rod protein FlgC [Sedimentisphaerales bacterium]
MTINSVFGPVDISVSGMRAHDQSMEVISSNIANARTLDAGQGKPYRRLQTILQSENEGVSGVVVGDIVQDMSALQRIYEPGNPKADASGYITMPNVQLPVEMMNLSVASRAYQANAAILKRYQKMVETTLELLR